MNFTRRKTLTSLISLAGFSMLGGKPIRQNDLPHVFIIGDSISIGYTPFVKKFLEGKAIVSRPAQNCNGTKLGIVKLDEWLGNEKYDLIHFNFGLHDIKHIDPNTGDGTNNPLDPVQTDLATYKSNLVLITEKLKATRATVVFATTTPVVGKSDRGVLREPEQLTKYNQAALRIMRKNRVKVNDLFGYAQKIVKEYQIPNDVHFTDAGYELLGRQVSQVIAHALGL